MQFLRALEVLLRWKNFILINLLVVAILASAVTFLLPNWYKATASILPPKEEDLFGAAVGGSSLLKGLGAKALGNLGKSSTNYNYLAILKSRTSMEAVINKFDLLRVYGFSSNKMDKAVKELEENTSFEMQDEDNITIDVYDEDPKRAADMANYFVEILNSTSIRLSTQEGRNNREFLGKRLEQCRNDLHQAEDSLTDFQEKKGVIIAQNADNTSIAAYAQLYVAKAKKEIEVAVLEKEVTPESQALVQAQAELRALDRKLEGFPEIGMEGIRLYRDVVTQEKILEFLLPIYEQARIDEQKDVPVLLVLDNASPPQRKAKPLRTLIVSLTSFLGLAISVMLVFFFRRIELDREVESPLAIQSRMWLSRIMRVYGIHP